MNPSDKLDVEVRTEERCTSDIILETSHIPQVICRSSVFKEMEALTNTSILWAYANYDSLSHIHKHLSVITNLFTRNFYHDLLKTEEMDSLDAHQVYPRFNVCFEISTRLLYVEILM